MSFFAKITALLLLALWMPATLHCDLEATGLLEDSASHSCCQTEDNPCADETCRDFTRASTSRTLAAPSLNTAHPWANAFTALLSQLAFTEQKTAGAQLRHGDTPTIQTIARTWSFVRRSALPARAPASVA